MGFLLKFLLSSLCNYWIWHTFHNNLFFCLWGIFLSLFILKFNGSTTAGLLVVLISIFFVAIFFLQTSPKLIFDLSDLEIYTINERRSYYSRRFIGQFLENKPLYIFSKWQKNVFESLDINNYFFASHPRERLGISEYKKFPFIYLPVFLFGLFQIIKKKHAFLFLYPVGSILFIPIFKEIGESLFILFPWFVFILFEGFGGLFTFLITYLNNVKNQE